MATLKELYNVGQEIVVKICEPKIGKFPIGKLNSKVICLFERTDKKVFFEINSEWKVQIVEVKDKNLVIRPIEEVRSSKEVDDELKNKLEELMNKYKK